MGAQPDAGVLAEAEDLLGGFVRAFRSECWSGADAGRLVEAFARIERLAAAGKSLAARRVEATGGWKTDGHATAEEWLASRSGTSVTAASQTLATARRVEDCPATEQAMRSGKLSASQAALVASAASVDPGSETALLDDAERGGHGQLARHARAVRAAALSRTVDAEAIHRSRYLRHWTAEDGAVEGRFRLAPDKGATVLAALRHHHGEVFDEHRQAGERESPDAYEADALVAMAAASVTAGGSEDDRAGGARATIHVRVDRSAFVRGYPEAGEVCEIDGIGPVPVGVVRRAASDAVLWAILCDGDRLIDVRWAGRTLPDRLRTALVERDRHCQVPGCDRTRHLEIHHLTPFARGGEGSLLNLARICTHHHDLITHRGGRLSGSWPHWVWDPPGTSPPPTEDPEAADAARAGGSGGDGAAPLDNDPPPGSGPPGQSPRPDG